tara:strand:+ start:426 stop:2357 length:1932 start_codon:yes stop_codon:yes gene_type:complete
MTGKLYILGIFLTLYWGFCLFVGFKNEKKIITPVEFFIFSRQLPSWSFFAIVTSTIFSGWIFFVHPSLIFTNGFPYSITSLFVIAIPLVGILFSKRQWMLSKKFGFVTPSEMISTYFKSDILRILIVIITLGFSIPFIAMQLSLGGLLINIISDNLIGKGSAAILIGAIIAIYLSTGGIRSIIYIDSIQFLLIIFGVICIGFIAYDLVGGWSLLNESLSRVANLKENLFNSKETYNSLLAVPGTIKITEILNENISYNGIWTSSMILTFVFALTGIQLSPNMSMLTFASKEVKYFGTQQIWFSAFLIGFLLIFFTTGIGIGSILLGGNNVINESGNNVSNILPPTMYPNETLSLVPNLINLVGEYSFVFFGVLALCAIASIQATSSLYLSSSAIVTRDILKRFFVKNLNNKEQIFTSRIVLLFIFIFSLACSIIFSGKIFDLGSFALSMACQMLVPLIAICYFYWFTKQGVAFGIIIGIIAVIFTESIGKNIFGDLIPWNKWPLTIHSSAWGIFFNLVGASIVSFITQETKETNHKRKFHDFIEDNKNYSLTRRSLKPSAWIILIAWLFFALGPGLIMGNELFGKPINVESWSFGMPSIWVWQIVFWILGVLLIWFLAIKMEMSTSPPKTIIPQTDDISSSNR